MRARTYRLRMKRLAAIALVLSLTGCGAGDGSDAAADEPAGPAESTSEPAAGTSDETDTSRAYIDPADTGRLNEASESVRRVTETANSREEYDTCAGKPDDAQVVTCFNRLFEPVAAALEEQAASLRELAEAELREECVQALRGSVEKTERGIAAIEALIVQPDASVAEITRVAEQRYDVLVATYGKTQRAITGITRPCFSQ
jgi:hypothetical protein